MRSLFPALVGYVILIVFRSFTKTEVEPQLTLRGHSAPITRLLYSSARCLLYSASLDSTIRIWRLPVTNHTTYAPFDASLFKCALVGHSNAVWDIALVRDENILISCGADGTVKVWDVGPQSQSCSLRLSWGYKGVTDEETEGQSEDSFGATAIEAIKTDLKKVAVAYRNAVVKIFDIDSGKEISKLESDLSYGSSRSFDLDPIILIPK